MSADFGLSVGDDDNDDHGVPSDDDNDAVPTEPFTISDVEGAQSQSTNNHPSSDSGDSGPSRIG
jgi:hypothetical protein